MTRQLTSKEVKEVVTQHLVKLPSYKSTTWGAITADFNKAYAQPEVPAPIEGVQSRVSAKDCTYSGGVTVYNVDGRVHAHCWTCEAVGEGDTLDGAKAAITCAR